MRDLPGSLKHLTLWLLILTVVFLAVQYAQHERQRSQVRWADGTIEIRRSADGHFYWPGTINDQSLLFLIDTGATQTALPGALAEQLQLERGRPVQSSTAGGLVQGHRSRADVQLQGGVMASRLEVTVLPALNSPLLGMDVLGRLRLTQQDGILSISASDQATSR